MGSDLNQALRIAISAHWSDVDKSGEPYILHVLRVVATVDGGETERVVAALHDVVEDNPLWPIGRLETEFEQDIIDAVEHLTHRKGEGYSDYIKRVAGNPIAKAVKIADLQDNMRLAFDEHAFKRRKKYEQAWAYLVGLTPSPDTVRKMEEVG